MYSMTLLTPLLILVVQVVLCSGLLDNTMFYMTLLTPFLVLMVQVARYTGPIHVLHDSAHTSPGPGGPGGTVLR
jgi:hypothetical protein